jgi:tRNA pseudouridine32 synthase/23S rRNA pseudouridine746 synthase
MNGSLDVAYGDDALVVMNKPVGLLTVPGRGPDKQDCLVLRARQSFPDALVVHRLDMATSGLIVFGRGAEMQKSLSRSFREHRVVKRYTAVVAGKPAQSGEIDLPIAADWPNRPKQKVDANAGKPSLTRYWLLAHDAEEDISRLELAPITGRTHQLRLHMAAIGHPILGDTLYGGRRAERMLLHAHLLSFVHPLTGKTLECACPPQF